MIAVIKLLVFMFSWRLRPAVFVSHMSFLTSHDLLNIHKDIFQDKLELSSFNSLGSFLLLHLMICSLDTG